jgi:IS5 family transposase
VSNSPSSLKGNQWYFGMKAHFGVDSWTKLMQAAATPANVADSAVLPHLLHGNETRVSGDQAYRGQSAVIRRHAPTAKDFVNESVRNDGSITARPFIRQPIRENH